MVEEAHNHQKTHKIHHTLAKSYSIYFICFLVGIFLDLLLKIRIVNTNFMSLFGIILIIIGTILAFWAQKSTRDIDMENAENISFEKGPYVFTRTPTHFGLFFLVLGFGFVINALFVIITTIIAFLLTKLLLLRRWEELLEEKYGDLYRNYKKKVRI